MNRVRLCSLYFLGFSLCLLTGAAGASDPLRGAYTLPDGSVVAISPFDGAMRFFMQNGRTGSLVNVNEGAFVGSEPGLGISEPTHTLLAKDGTVVFNWEGEDHSLTKVPITQTDHTFISADLKLRGRLLLPSDGYSGVVILVHGSENYSALDNNYLPYLLVANRLAVFVYDKRGTGYSEGDYTQDFSLLAADLLAAVDFVSQLPDTITQPLLLAAFSQGGWVAPLAATQSNRVDGIFVGYGPAVSLAEEDRWGYAYWLQKEGYSLEDQKKADQLFTVLTDMRSRGTPDRWSELKTLIDNYEDERWYRVGLSGTDSSLAVLVDSPVPLTLIYWWTSLFGLDQFVDYDPAPVLAELDVPSYWLFAGEDASMPTGASVGQLQKLAIAGKPVSHKVYPDTSHGIVLFKQGEDRRRDFVAYHPEYYTDMIRWLQTQATR